MFNRWQVAGHDTCVSDTTRNESMGWQNVGASVRIRKEGLQASTGQGMTETSQEDGPRMECSTKGRVSKSLLWPMISHQGLVVGESCAKGSVQGQENLAGMEYFIFKEN